MTNNKVKKLNLVYEPNKLYELTIAPDDDRQYRQKGDIRDICCVAFYRELLKGLHMVYSLRTEITMPQHGQDHYLARIHFHGFVYWKSYQEIYEFFLVDFHTLNRDARIQFNYARKNYWLAYMLKSIRYIPENVFRVECIRLTDILILPEATAENCKEDMEDLNLDLEENIK